MSSPVSGPFRIEDRFVSGASSRRCFLGTIISLAAAGRARGQFEELIGLGQQWLGRNIDPAAVEAIRSGNPAQLDKLLQSVSQGLQGDYVLDLAAFGEVASVALPFLERTPETKPYAPWLRSRLDYFRVAERFRNSAPVTQTPRDQKPAPPPNPTPLQERQVWQKQIGQQPAPKGAAVWATRLKPVLKSAGAPGELVWLAEIESSFDATARSPAGALGMFQLMPQTAQNLGLQLRPNDQRLEPEKSARAAGVFLRRLFDQFKDWALVLAAYNAGPGRVAEILKKRRARSFDAIAPSLPAETQMYVPKFEAVLRKREGLVLGALKLPAKS